ncbi:MAG: DUF4831 family protein [Prevotellaceae bacterium]|nr:DUF4831 family protein [Candidatus Faecinaster equi]
MNKNCMILLGLLSLCITAKSQTEVQNIQPRDISEGIAYYLPKTALKISVTVTQTKYTPGDLASYASRYFKLSNVNQTPTTTWNLDNVAVETYGIPDTSKFYIIPLKKGTSAPLVGLTSDGIITSINVAESDNNEKMQEHNTEKKSSNKLNSKEYFTGEMLEVNNKAKLAELVATEIYDIRTSRNLLSRGEADFMPKDGTQLQIMIDQLNKQEQALTQLFKGSEETTTTTKYIYYVPENKVVKETFFRFSDILGVVDNDNLAGEPVYIDVCPLNNSQVSSQTTLSPSQLKKLQQSGVRYNIPCPTSIKIYSSDNILLNNKVSIAQFGFIEYLSADLFNKREDTHILFDSVTGGIKKIYNE